MAIDVESLIPFILGTGLITTTLTLLGTYSLNRRQKSKDRKDRINDKMIAKVYSPFYFYMLQVIGNIGATMGNFIGFMESDFEIELSKKVTIDRIREINCPLFCSTSMRDVLNSNIGFIKPEAFRRELAFYFMLLNSYENEVNRFVTEGFNDDLEAEKKWIANMIDVSTLLVTVSTKLLVNFDKLMCKDGNQKTPLVFKISLPIEVQKEISAKIYSRNSLYVSSYERNHKPTQENRSM